jgi:hypothetical protein
MHLVAADQQEFLQIIVMVALRVDQHLLVLNAPTVKFWILNYVRAVRVASVVIAKHLVAQQRQD